MDKIYEIFKSISAYFNLLLSISGVSLALLLSPTVDNMEDVFKELNALKKIDVGQYESFVQKRTSYADFLPKSGVSGYGLDSLLRDAYRQQRRGDSLRLNLVNRYNFTWKILPYVASYNLPPADGTLKDWESWIKSDSNADCYRPRWTYLDPDRKPFINTDTVYWLRYLMLEKLKGSNDIYPVYSYRFYLEKDTTTTLAPPPQGRDHEGIPLSDWFSALDSISYDSLRLADILFNPDIINPQHLIIEGRQAADSFKLTVPYSGVSRWLTETANGILLSRSANSLSSVLPAAHKYWSEISDKTVDESLGYLQKKRNESISLNLFGISISYVFALTIIPLAYLCMNILLLFHLQYLNSELRLQMERPTFPWFGLYNSTGASLFRVFIFFLLPLINCFFLTMKLGSTINNYLLWLSILLSTLAVLSGFLLIKENTKLRKFTNSIRKT